ncbi:ROK family transcriptional regulator [Nonomuraea sp. NPDC050556]|uniref:ROK family transcriptional regulator n=1 Tax=Nonomuraea sp. NPDC050556 TaxID=3364369 RepID=UPI0037ABAB32
MPTPRTADPALMRRLNEVATLRAMHGQGALTISRVLELTGLSRSTGEAVLDGLTADGWVLEVPPEHAGRMGRPARTFRFLAEAGRVMAVDIGAHQVAVEIADLDGQVVARHRERASRTDSRASRLAATRTAVSAASAQAGAGLLAMAVGTPGLVRDDGVVSLCRVLPEWSDLDLAAELRDLVGCPVVVENDINLSVMAERWRGAAVGVDDLVWVSVGRSTSAAIVIDGRLYRGYNGAAGEFGWIGELGWERVRDHPLSFAGVTGTTHGDEAARIIQAARAGDAAALGEVDRFAALIAPGLAAITLAYDPRRLLVGGAVAAAEDLFVPALTRFLEPRCLNLPEVRASGLGEEATVTGALRIALDTAEARLFSLEERITPRSP